MAYIVMAYVVTAYPSPLSMRPRVSAVPFEFVNMMHCASAASLNLSQISCHAVGWMEQTTSQRMHTHVAEGCGPRQGHRATQHHRGDGPTQSLGPVSMGREKIAMCSHGLVVEVKAAVLSEARFVCFCLRVRARGGGGGGGGGGGPPPPPKRGGGGGGGGAATPPPQRKVNSIPLISDQIYIKNTRTSSNRRFEPADPP